MALGKNSAHSARLSAHAMQVSTESKHEEGETSDGPLGALFPTNTASFPTPSQCHIVYALLPRS